MTIILSEQLPLQQRLAELVDIIFNINFTRTSDSCGDPLSSPLHDLNIQEMDSDLDDSFDYC